MLALRLGDLGDRLGIAGNAQLMLLPPLWLLLLLPLPLLLLLLLLTCCCYCTVAGAVLRM